MNAKIYAAPTAEPLSIAELKTHLRVDTTTFSDQVDTTISIAPGSHAIAADYTTHIGTAVDVLGYNAVVNLVVGSVVLVGAGTIDVKIQESDEGVIFNDWTGGAFTQVNGDTDYAVYEKAYTGTKQYIRTVAQVLVGACDFSTEIVRYTSITASEDTLLNSIITAAREQVEDITRRALLTQTWDLRLNDWPEEDYIKLPFGNLQSVTSIKWKDTDGTETTLTETTDFLVETNGDQCGRIVLPYGGSWPSDTLYPSNPITIRFICGWTTAALVPYRIKAAMKLICADLFQNREGQILSGQSYQENKTVMALLQNARLWDEI